MPNQIQKLKKKASEEANHFKFDLTLFFSIRFSGKLYDVVAKSQIKKMTKLWQQDVRKAAERVKKEAEAAEAQAKKAEEAKKITITEDKDLPKAVRSKLRSLEPLRGKRIKVYGWVHRLRRQGKSLMFLTVRDGTSFLQCVLNGSMCQTYDAIMLSTESTVSKRIMTNIDLRYKQISSPLFRL